MSARHGFSLAQKRADLAWWHTDPVCAGGVTCAPTVSADASIDDARRAEAILVSKPALHGNPGRSDGPDDADVPCGATESFGGQPDLAWGSAGGRVRHVRTSDRRYRLDCHMVGVRP